MREILFRGKRVDNGKWVEGSLYIDPDLKTASIWWFGYSEDGMERWEEAESVDPETVGQFIGLTDKNGVKIFEGDIIKWKYLCNNHLVYQVVYEKGAAGFVTRRNVSNRDGIDCYSDSVFVDDGDMSEVIGNIHDNPELLEVSE